MSIGFRDAEDSAKDAEKFHEGLLHNLRILLKNTYVGVKVDVYLERKKEILTFPSLPRQYGKFGPLFFLKIL